MKNIYKAILLSILGTALLMGCSVTRKLSALDIIQHTKVAFEGIALDSMAIYPEAFPKGNGFLPDPKVVKFAQNLSKGIIEEEVGKIFLTASSKAQNQHKDTLWLRSLKATLRLDSLVTMPVDMQNTIKLAPGENDISLSTVMPIDGSLFHLSEVDTVHFEGTLSVSLTADEEPTPIEFSIHRFFSAEEKKDLANQAKRNVVDTIMNQWLGPRNKF